MSHIKCRVFKVDYAWSYHFYYIPENISFNELKEDKNINILSKKHYIGLYNLPTLLLENYHKTNKYYYVININD